MLFKVEFTSVTQYLNLLEIINYWEDQKEKNTGKMNIAHYMNVCKAKARILRWTDNDKTWTQIFK